MTAEQLMMIYCGLLALILILGFIGGTIHGRRKAIFKLFTTLVFYTVFFVFIDKIAIFLVDYPFLPYLVNAGIQLPEEIAGATTIKEACDLYLVNIGLTSDEIIPILMSFAVVVTKIIVTLVYFIVIGLVYCILVNIIYYAFFRRKRARLKALERKQATKENMTENVVTKKKKKLKLKQHRFTGGLLGFVKKVPQVIVIIAVTTGIISLIPTITRTENGKTNLTVDIQSDELMDIIEKNNLTEYVRFVEIYRNSPFVKILGGDSKDNKRVSGLIFDKLTSGKYEEYELDLQSEMAFMVGTGAKAYSIMGGNFDVNALTKEQQIQMCALLNELTNSNLIMSLLPVGASVALSLDQVKNTIAQKAPGLEEKINPSLLENVDWNNDIKRISETAIALVELTDGFQNIDKLDFTHTNPDPSFKDVNPEDVETLMTCISNINILMNIIPVVAEYALTLDEVKDKIGDLSEEIKDILWDTELVNISKIYGDFIDIGFESFDNIMAELTEQPEDPEHDKLKKTQDLVDTMFASQFVDMAFPLVFDKVIEGQPKNVQDLFRDIKISEWDNELKTVLDLAIEVREGGGTIDKLDLGIVRDVNIDTILKSDLLTQGFTNIFRTYKEPDSIGASIGLDKYIYVPEEYINITDMKDNVWFKKAEKDVDENGNEKYNVEHRELASILKAFQDILPAEGEINFENLPNYILEIDDKKLTNDNDPNRGKEGYSSIFDSLVLRTSISHMVETTKEITDYVTVPLTATEQIDDIHSIKMNELNNMVKGLKALGIKDFTNLQITNELIENLENPYSGDKTKTNLDVILSSEIVNLTLANLLDQQAGATGGQLVIPLEAKDPKEIVDIKGVSHKAIKEEEIKKIVKVVNMIKIDFADPKFDISLITDLTDSQIDEILDSKIINYNLTAQVVNLGGPEGQLVIPDDKTVINSGYIGNTEVKSIVKAFKYMNITDFSNIQINNELLAKFVEVPAGESKNVLSIALDSKILQSTITSQIEKISNENLVIPLEAKENAKYKDINGTEHQNIKVDEFNLMINIVLDLNIDISNPKFDISIITGLDDAKLDSILASKIIHYNLTLQVVKLGGPDGQLIIPDDKKVIDNGYIGNTEVKSILKAFKYMEITDFNNIQINNELLQKFVTVPEGESKNVLSIALDSKILQSTITSQIENISNENLVIPLDAKDANKFKDINGIEHQNIKVDEFNLMIGAVLDLNVDIANPQFDISIITGLDDAKLDSILQSKVIHYNLTSQVVKLGDPTGQLVIPNDVTVLNNGYIANNEIKSIVKALRYLEFNSFDGIVINNELLEKFVSIPAGETKTILSIALDSKILHSTLSDKISNLNTDQLAIPNDIKEATFKDINDVEHQNITTSEFNNMINSVLALGIQIDNPQFSLSLITTLTDDKVIEILKSKIIHFNMTKVIKDLGTDGTIIIPKTSIDVKQYIAENEILSIIGLLRNLGIDDFTNLQVNSELITKLNSKVEGKNKTAIELALESGILQATLSDKIMSVSGDTLVIPAEAKESSPIVDINEVSHTNLTVNEFSTLVKVLDMLKIDINNPTFSIDKLLALTHSDIDTVLSSYTINYNMTNTIKDLGKDETLVIPNSKQVINGDYIVNSEIYAIVDTLNVLGLADFGDINISANILGKLVVNPGKVNQDTTNIKNMFASKILKATISSKILDMSTTITIPEEVKEVFGGVNMIKDDEFINMIVAVAVSNTDLNKFELGTIYKLNSSLPEDLVFDSKKKQVTKLSVMLDSKIIHGTISKSLLDVTAIDKPSEVVDGSYIVKDEISALINALQTLVPDATDFNNIAVNKSALFNLVDGNKNEGLNKVLSSKIIHYTISKKFIGLGSAIIIPSIAKDGEYITSTELGNLIYALKVIAGPDDSGEDFSINFNASNLLGFADHISTILKSNILHATVSDILIKTDSLVKTESIRQEFINEDNTVCETSFIKANEIESLFKILKSLGTSDMSKFTVDENMIMKDILGNPSIVMIVKDSTIMRATLTPVASQIKINAPIPNMPQLSLVQSSDLEKQKLFGSTTEVDVLKVSFFEKYLGTDK